jgi:hypothetical protein
MPRTPAILAAIALSLTASMAFAADVSDAQKAQAKENFIAADGNADQKLDRAEFEAFIRANAKHNIGKAAKVVRFGAFDRAFAQMDADGDGFVTGAETKAK